MIQEITDSARLQNDSVKRTLIIRKCPQLFYLERYVTDRCYILIKDGIILKDILHIRNYSFWGDIPSLRKAGYTTVFDNG